ncbi:hypothetical protein BC937DRAFT_90904 [Endogone sp. FLAS-F59071]|nr:hypothetical protein BC937DRAFT_90904 [Endogone sp. FLAS-F59071]|eukprot:RUS21949.1 hypothetical protein BC937DRAFT_90904 [Endogone sp. FLAS-F59071]
MSTTFIQFTATELPPPPPYSVHGSSIETYDPITSAIYEKLDTISQIDYPYPPAIEFAGKGLRIASTEDPSPWEDKVAELEDIIDSLQSELDGTRQFMDDLQQRLDPRNHKQDHDQRPQRHRRQRVRLIYIVKPFPPSINLIFNIFIKPFCIPHNRSSVTPSALSTFTSQSFLTKISSTNPEIEIETDDTSDDTFDDTSDDTSDSHDDHYSRLCSSLQQLIDEAESCLSVSPKDSCFTTNSTQTSPTSLALVSVSASPKYIELATETIITMNDPEDDCENDRYGNSEKKDVKVWSRRHQPSRTRTHTRIRSLRRSSRSSSPARLRSRRVGMLSPSLRSLPTTPTTPAPPPYVSSTLRKQYARYLESQESLVRQFDDLMDLAADSETADVPVHIVEDIVMTNQNFDKREPETQTQSEETGSWWPIEAVNNFFSLPIDPVLEEPALEPVAITESNSWKDSIVRFMSIPSPVPTSLLTLAQPHTATFPPPFLFTMILLASFTRLMHNSRLRGHVTLDLDPLFSNTALDFTLITYTIFPLFVMWSGARPWFVGRSRWIRLLDESLYVGRIVLFWSLGKLGPRWVRKSVLARMRASGSV